MVRTTRIESLSNSILSLQETLGKARVLLFGSRARGEERPDSDYDLLIISDAFEGMRYHARCVLALNHLPYDIDVDVICLTPAEFTRQSNSISIVAEAAKDAVELVA